MSETASASTTAATPGTTNMSIWRALNAALTNAMSEDPTVFVMGEDLTKWGSGGGIYGVTKRLVDEFGSQRVRDTPISEEVIVSAAVGAAIRGSRPIVEIMYSDFSLLAMDALVNQAAKARYMSGGQFAVPMVLRTNGGSGLGKAAQHSQSLETIFAHIPGLEVAVPATANDAYGLLRSAIASPNPTIFLEHKALYNERGPVSFLPVPLGRANVVRVGGDATVVATQLMLHRALRAAEVVAEDGIEIEVVDPRTIYPLDIETIGSSVLKTGRLLVAHEAPSMFGFGAEIVAAISQELWGSLRARPRRIGGARSPIPYSEPLERAVVPSTENIVLEIRALVA